MQDTDIAICFSLRLQTSSWTYCVGLLINISNSKKNWQKKKKKVKSYLFYCWFPFDTDLEY